MSPFGALASRRSPASTRCIVARSVRIPVSGDVHPPLTGTSSCCDRSSRPRNHPGPLAIASTCMVRGEGSCV
ncbi:hypothetical protein [Actinokineospora bangkokensis]|uniref:hypothetical protein n=1 Tax=Actinokineospora bangkokensis TaxID=1193682 RepID=UPI00117862A6|nr:hypothetical protein [Actinokineospora bangkokensis]